MTRLLGEEYQSNIRDSEDRILEAFYVSLSPLELTPQVLDPEKKGWIEAEELRKLVATMGEKFSQVNA
jgi:Ca2+-binding EF-hand superfamily protein